MTLHFVSLFFVLYQSTHRHCCLNSSWPSATYMRRDFQCLFPQRPTYVALISVLISPVLHTWGVTNGSLLASPPNSRRSPASLIDTPCSALAESTPPPTAEDKPGPLPSRTPALLGLGWIPLDLGAFNLGLIAPVTAQTPGYRSAWSPGTALSHLGSASLVAQGLYSDIGLQNVGTNGLSFVLGRLSYRTSIYT